MGMETKSVLITALVRCLGQVISFSTLNGFLFRSKNFLFLSNYFLFCSNLLSPHKLGFQWFPDRFPSFLLVQAL